ncbi:MAG TPA: prepilin-type N-terminal cleavage/methylation domain-containing protein [Patescibacteria group bacterium]
MSGVFKKNSGGFSLIEMIIAILIATLLMGAVIGLYAAMTRTVKSGREQTIIRSLTSHYLEIVRNLPYSQIGTVVGNPNGSLPDQSNPIQVTIEGTLYKIYYSVTYIDDPADGTALAGTDPAPNDYKQVKMFIQNNTTSVIRSFLTFVTPKGLEGTNNAGALVIKAIDASGQPVPNAAVHIENLALSPNIILDRTADSTGTWIEVGLPASVNGYHIVVTKTGYSSDQTYPITVGNPNPVKPDATIVTGGITQLSFAIDLLSSLTVKTLNNTCGNLSGVSLNLRGSKLIGTSPNVYKYNQNLISTSGQIALSNIEWDVYTPTLLTGQSLMVLGTSPIQQISVLPNTAQTFTMILGTQTANSLLVIVKDSASGLALQNAAVNLHKTSPVTDFNVITGGSVWSQKDWSGGSGQASFTNTTRYFSDDGNIDVASTPTGVRLNRVAGNYVASGQLISSTFDTGASSNFTTITWEPTSQNPATSLKFQIASNNDNTTWNFLGPDGTAGTFYTVSGSNIAAAHNGNRYVRYKMILATTNNQQTPVATSVAVNYVSGCFTPGQVMFGGLTAAADYTLTVTLTGYQNSVVNNININGNQSLQVLLSP